MRQSSGHPILVNGLIYGVLVLVVSLISDGLSLAGIKLTEPATALAVSGVILLVDLALFFLAGRAAAAKTGTVGAGALAGLFAGAIAGIVGAVISIVRTVLDPGAIRDAALKANPAVNPSALTDQVIIATGIVSAIIGLLFILGVGAGAGARRPARPAEISASVLPGVHVPGIAAATASGLSVASSADTAGASHSRSTFSCAWPIHSQQQWRRMLSFAPLDRLAHGADTPAHWLWN